MKKILFLEYDFNFGGREKVSLDVLSKLAESCEYDVQLCLLHEGGIWDDKIPQNVKKANIFDIDMEDVRKMISDADKKYSLSVSIKEKRIINAAKILIKRKYRKNRELRYAEIIKHVLPLEYDYVICPSLTASVLPSLAISVNSKKRIAWLHRSFCRYRDVKKLKLTSEAAKSNLLHLKDIIHKFDKIVCVSDSVKKIFDYYFKDMKDRSVVLYNAMDMERIKTLSEQVVFDIPDGALKLATVGRAEKEKGIYIMLDAAQKLKARGYKFVWYYVGDGSELNNAMLQANKLNVNDCVVFLNSRDNPYPYIKACDIYVQPSVVEAYCTTVNEARILSKPIVATAFAGITEQIIDGHDGIICDIKGSALADALKKAIDGDMWKNLANNSCYPNSNERDNIFSATKLFD